MPKCKLRWMIVDKELSSPMLWTYPAGFWEMIYMEMWNMPSTSSIKVKEIFYLNVNETSDTLRVPPPRHHFQAYIHSSTWFNSMPNWHNSYAWGTMPEPWAKRWTKLVLGSLSMDTYFSEMTYTSIRDTENVKLETEGIVKEMTKRRNTEGSLRQLWWLFFYFQAFCRHSFSLTINSNFQEIKIE